MISSLVGQFVVNGYSDLQYHEIVAVTANQDSLTIWATNPDGLISSYNADGCKVARRISTSEPKGGGRQFSTAIALNGEIV